MIELVDLLPSIAELAGVDLPTNEVFDGTSFVALLGGGAPAADHLAAPDHHLAAADRSGNHLAQISRRELVVPWSKHMAFSQVP